MFIVGNIIGCIFWGALIGLFVTVLVFVICTLINRNTLPLPIALIVFGGYFVVSATFGTLLTSAYYAKGYLEDLRDFTEQLTNTNSGTIRSATEFSSLKNAIVDEFPISQSVIEKVDPNEIVNYINAGNSVADYLTTQINDRIDEYVQKCLFGLIFATLIAVILSTFNLRKPKAPTTTSDISQYCFDNDTSTASYY